MHETPFMPLVELTRGPIVESVHWGALAIVDSRGRLLASLGDPYLVMHLRSTAKPFQLLPLIEEGAVEHFSLTPEEIAVMCASHSGTDEHVQVIARLQAKLGIEEKELQCGVHPPFHEPTWQAMIQRNETPTPNRHNCSGKHTNMLAQAALLEASREDYLDPQHPVQQRILHALAEMCNISLEDIRIGIDGCSAPVFALPLYHAALGYARLCDPVELSPQRAQACRTITSAMTKAPFMVAGPGRFDTLVMEIGMGKIIAKGGAEGYQGIGLLPGALGPDSPGIGITFKIADGDPGGRARPVVAIEVLRQLGVLNEDQIQSHLADLAPRPLKNWRGLSVGEIRPVFKLEWQRSFGL
ncbi:asparaginase [Thermanaerothrix sp. 4228-RoL]|uniref:Asparaginase n=1 Tax=Thermanaerothrix solaris TaxID=3058434 RepID=A0ABU3NRA6_9CHLR|nr:asparaginase [Thermanaerothrix sp. 4228-RoL]MDT8899356.1 asparaginase [Thermanaerothrix sp. 4228-RoL]